MYKYVILGAGPAGLTFANCLKDTGETSFIVLEKEAEAGGLCRSQMVDGKPLDIGGGHFLDVRQPEVNNFLFRFMPENEWSLYTRNSKIEINGNLVDHPIEANIWQMSLNDQIEYLKSIAIAGCNTGEEMPSEFISWIYWKLGQKIANDYMIPYNSKMFGENLNALGTYWLEKLPNVSFDETLLSCLTQKAYGTQPGHAQFYYPNKYGYGELWLRMAMEIHQHILYETIATEIDFDNIIVTDNHGNKYQAKNIITTVPWNGFAKTIGLPQNLMDAVSQGGG